ncbi:ATP-binding cassette domain-containing protein [Homoserinibacter sp. GY 40078]|uniref:ATP-binding cassette domain-containing protein n=1 Tax=Homoserinibacter sp. GY 40078 TaxID=2603275 RepID=UPI0011CB1233|nr:dipeptide/oligopeptide/nickel ABC transporter ATP-binding protein [Homoserinibacter sp. GY 40078]TXK17371.1 ABC transporter ATP-binding protein [Homoserinibacter sp. GY 40078]
MSRSTVPAETAVLADDLTLAYPGDETPVINGVSLRLGIGETLGLIGEAGSGKTTLARAIASQSAPGERDEPVIAGGRLVVLGQELRRASRGRRDALSLRVGYLPQDGGSSLHPQLTVGENVAVPIYQRDRRFDRLEAGGAVAKLVDAVRLPLSVLDRYPHELSRGQRQRIALARALVLEPELLVADDPTMGVDVLVRGPILEVVAELQRELGFSSIIVGHDLRELRRVVDRIAVLHAGLVVGYGTVDEVLADPLHAYVRRLAELSA